MAKLITIDKPVIIEENSGTITYLTTKLNNKTVGVPILSSASNSISLLQPTIGMNMLDSSTYTDDNVSPYTLPSGSSLGVAFSMSGVKYAVPIYEVPQNPLDTITLEFNTPTMVTNMSPKIGPQGMPQLLLFSIDGENFGLPLFEYDSVFDLKTNAITDAIPLTGTAPSVTTIISTGKPTIDFGDQFGSTYLNSKITAYSDLIERVKKVFGYPMAEPDICDENIAAFIDQSIELYTKYAGYTEEYLVFSTALYTRGIGVRLDKLFSVTPEMINYSLENSQPLMDYDLKDYRKVLNCSSVEPGQATGVNTLFTLEQAMAQQTYFSYLLGSYGFDLVTWNCVKNWLDDREKVLAQKIAFRFNPQTQYLRVVPEPLPGQSYLGLITCYVEKPIRELINEYWVYQYTVALCSIAIGRLRSKYSFQMLGGATITGDELLNHGLEDKKSLDEQLWTGKGFVESQPLFFMA